MPLDVSLPQIPIHALLRCSWFASFSFPLPFSLSHCFCFVCLSMPTLYSNFSLVFLFFLFFFLLLTCFPALTVAISVPHGAGYRKGIHAPLCIPCNYCYLQGAAYNHCMPVQYSTVLDPSSLITYPILYTTYNKNQHHIQQKSYPRNSHIIYHISDIIQLSCHISDIICVSTH